MKQQEKTFKERARELLKKLEVHYRDLVGDKNLTLITKALQDTIKDTEERVIGKQANDMRKGQTIFNFLEWLKEEKGVDGKNKMADPFYITDDNWDKLFKEYTKSINKLKKKKEYKPTTSGAGSSNGPSQSVTRESVKEKVKEKVKIKNTLIAIPKDYNFVKVRHIGKIQVQLVKDIPNGATIKKMYIDDLK